MCDFIIFLTHYIATVFNNANQHINVYGDDIEVDYRGYEVNFLYTFVILSLSLSLFSPPSPSPSLSLSLSLFHTYF